MLLSITDATLHLDSTMSHMPLSIAIFFLTSMPDLGRSLLAVTRVDKGSTFVLRHYTLEFCLGGQGKRRIESHLDSTTSRMPLSIAIFFFTSMADLGRSLFFVPTSVTPCYRRLGLAERTGVPRP